ncbi:hypothetical protein NQ315_011828 [Exocentrus adspersus]|uniref:N-acetyltransferase domain-containing protein n=1 Tax=Exocentrus adspersus TaxID=1586481 RepID=A0AAV8W1Z0_9CUCU|nr:hypothetical protein NQ315_011828 [Exocentrus adspersus]
MDWKRPQDLAYPKMWGTFEGKRGRYWIQDLTCDYYEEVLQHMCKNFVKKSPICIYTNFSEDEESVNDYKEAWKRMLELKLSLICLTENADDNTTKFVGCNILGRRYKGEKRNVDEVYKGKASRISGRALDHIYQNCVDVYSVLDIDQYMSAFGLYVLPEYRGEGVGYHLLKTRRDVCLAVGMEASVTAFTTISGQKLAEKVGFKDLLEIPYKDLEKIDPLFRFPGIENGDTRTVRLMYNKYEVK